MFNPKLLNFWVGLLGVRSYVWYSLVIFIGYYYFSSKMELVKYCKIFTYTAIPLIFVVIIQLIFPNFLPALEGSHEYHTAPSGDIHLISSIFGTGPRYASVCLITFFCGMGLTMGGETAKNKWLLIATFLSFTGIILSGSRSPMICALFGIAWFIIASFSKKLFGRKKSISKRVINIFLLLLSLIILLMVMFPETLSFFMWGITTDFAARFYDLLDQIKYIIFINPNSLLGFGAGTVSQGADILSKLQTVQAPIDDAVSIGIEYGIIKIWHELGLIGVFIYLLYLFAMFISWRKAYLKNKGTDLEYLSCTLYIYFATMIFWFFKGHQIFGDAITLILYWFFMGVLFKLHVLSKRESS
jgi:hypothetical protein